MDFLDREIPNTLNRRLDVSGPDHCRRTRDEYLPGFQALRYVLRYELAGRVVVKEMIVAPIVIDREEMGTEVTEETEGFQWDFVLHHDQSTTAGAFHVDLDGTVTQIWAVFADGTRLPVDERLGARFRAFFQNGLKRVL